MVDKDSDSIVIDTDTNSNIVTKHLEDEFIADSEMQATDWLVAQFQFPLKSAGADVSLIKV